MQVFLSWSGEQSRLVAEALRDWLPSVLQLIKPWMSGNDIEKGARWSTDIAGELDQSDVGILCLTPSNLNAPWILFEAGALSKKLGKSLVCPYLVGLRPTDVTGPLVQFQATTADHEETFKLLQTINRALGERGLSESTLGRVFQKWWPDLEQQLLSIPPNANDHEFQRSEREMIEETLSLVREIAEFYID